jgi:ribosome-associated toxin RatA of RatAB toxin-antitoxin module
MITLTIEMNSNAPPDAVWSVVSNIQNMPKYWRLHRDVKILERADPYLRVLVNLTLLRPFNRGEALVRVSNADLTVVFNFIRGPFRGRHVIKVNGDKVVSTWMINPTIPLLIRKSWLVSRLREATINALTRLINDAASLGSLNQPHEQ